MRVTRLKRARKRMSVFKTNFDFREPFQVLVDGTFCQAAITNKAFVQQSVGFIFKGQVKFLTTPCVVKEAEKLGSFMMGATLLLKQCKIHYCSHKKAVGATECILSMVQGGNKSHYLVATQDDALRKKCGKTPGIPIIYLHGKVAVLAKETMATKKESDKRAVGRLGLNEREQEELQRMKAQIFGEEEEEQGEEEQAEEESSSPGKRKRKNDSKSAKKHKSKLEDIEDTTVKPKKKKDKNRVKKRDSERGDSWKQVEGDFSDDFKESQLTSNDDEMSRKHKKKNKNKVIGIVNNIELKENKDGVKSKKKKDKRTISENTTNDGIEVRKKVKKGNFVKDSFVGADMKEFGNFVGDRKIKKKKKHMEIDFDDN